MVIINNQTIKQFNNRVNQVLQATHSRVTFVNSTLTLPQRLLNKYFYISVFLAIGLAVITGLFVLSYGKNDSFQLINSNHNGFLDFFFKYYTHAGDGIVWLPFGLYCIFYRREYLIAVIAGFIISTVLTHFLKRVVYPDELRPFTSLSVEFPIHIIEGVKMRRVHSFPSGHTGTAFAMALLLSQPVNKKLWSIILPVFALLVAYSRVYLGQHYVTDVLAGMAVGIVTAVLSIFIYQKLSQGKKH